MGATPARPDRSRRALYIWRNEILHQTWASVVTHSPRDERGQDLAEYAMLIGLIALLVVGVVTLLGSNLSVLLGDIASEVGP